MGMHRATMYGAMRCTGMMAGMVATTVERVPAL
jgi:hypothetical protein